MIKKLIIAAVTHAIAMAVIVLFVIGAIAMSKLTYEWFGYFDQAMHTIIWLCLAFGVFGAVQTWAKEDDK